MAARHRPSEGDAYVATIGIAVEDARELWAAAARRLLRSPGISLDDVDETIGPIEDPRIGECIAVLVLPFRLPGCMVARFDVREAVRAARVRGEPGKVIRFPRRTTHV